MTVVVNATPLIALARIGKLAVLQQLFEEVTTTPEVFAEVAVATRPGGEDVRSARWVHRRSVPPTEIARYQHHCCPN